MIKLEIGSTKIWDLVLREKGSTFWSSLRKEVLSDETWLEDGDKALLDKVCKREHYLIKLCYKIIDKCYSMRPNCKVKKKHYLISFKKKSTIW